MIILLSPAKKLYEDIKQVGNAPYFQQENQSLLKIMHQKSAKDLQKLMGISEKLANLNHGRYQHMATGNATKSPALLSFAGDVYQKLSANDFNDDEFAYANQHLAILSGLYGLLRPDDAIAPYRLEMGTKLPVGKCKNLHEFWRAKISDYLNELLQTHENKIILNLASQEYSKAVDEKKLSEFITISFRQKRGNQLKNIFLFTKQARGTMARHIIKQRVDTIADVKKLRFERYCFDDTLSEKNNLMFVQEEASA